MARSFGYEMTDDLFIGLAEQVKLPLIQILQEVELLKTHLDPSDIDASGRVISLSSEAALKLIDGYLLNISLEQQSQLLLEPVSLSSIAYDVAEALSPYAKSHGCELKLVIAGRYGPALGHREAVKAALTTLGYSLIDSITDEDANKAKIQLTVRRASNGLSTGIFSNRHHMTGAMMNRAHRLKGTLHQPLAAFDSGSSAGVFIAEALFKRLETQLQAVRLKGLSGFAATLLPSRQLNLV